MDRLEKLEKLSKAGLALRKELKYDMDKHPEIRMRAYLCRTEVIEEFDRIIAELAKKDPQGE